jgi:murein tripeptide amidase MpaA
MLNPDGVVLGNYRTSLCGRDLNRAFKASVDILFPEVRFLKDLALKLKDEYRNRLIVFLDFHGHSVKKNVFVYGP